MLRNSKKDPGDPTRARKGRSGEIQHLSCLAKDFGIYAMMEGKVLDLIHHRSQWVNSSLSCQVRISS